MNMYYLYNNCENVLGNFFEEKQLLFLLQHTCRHDNLVNTVKMMMSNTSNCAILIDVSIHGAGTPNIFCISQP